MSDTTETPSPTTTPSPNEGEPAAPDQRPEQQTNAEATSDEIELNGAIDHRKLRPLSKAFDSRFMISGNERKRVYAYANDPDTIAFTEHTNKLVMRDKNPSLIDSLLEVAESRGWTTIAVKGDKAFRRDVWLAASARGFEVQGHSPSEQDRRKLEHLTNQQNAIEKSDAEAEPSTPMSTLAQRTESKTSPKKVIESSVQERYQRLTHAFEGPNRESAVESFPELRAVHYLVPSAKAFYRYGNYPAHQERDFLKKVTERALRHLAEDKPLPEFSSEAYRSLIHDTQQIELEID